MSIYTVHSTKDVILTHRIFWIVFCVMYIIRCYFYQAYGKERKTTYISSCFLVVCKKIKSICYRLADISFPNLWRPAGDLTKSCWNRREWSKKKEQQRDSKERKRAEKQRKSRSRKAQKNKNRKAKKQGKHKSREAEKQGKQKAEKQRSRKAEKRRSRKSNEKQWEAGKQKVFKQKSREAKSIKAEKQSK